MSRRSCILANARAGGVRNNRKCDQKGDSGRTTIHTQIASFFRVRKVIVETIVSLVRPRKKDKLPVGSWQLY